MTLFWKLPAASLLLALAAQAAATEDAGKQPSPRISNAALSACVGANVPRHDDGATPVGEVARAIWQACRGDESQAVADSPTAVDMLHLRIRAMVTEHRNTVFAARAAKASAGKGASAGPGR